MAATTSLLMLEVEKMGRVGTAKVHRFGGAVGRYRRTVMGTGVASHSLVLLPSHSLYVSSIC